MYQNTSGGNVVFESLDKLMVISFDHLESCNLDGRLDQVWHQIISYDFISSRAHESSFADLVFNCLTQVFEKLFGAFENFILNTYKSKVSQVRHIAI